MGFFAFSSSSCSHCIIWILLCFPDEEQYFAKEYACRGDHALIWNGNGAFQLYSKVKQRKPMMSIQTSIFLPRYLRVNTTDVGLHREMRIAHLPFHYIKPCLCQRLLLIHVLEGLHRITFHFLSFKINLRSSEFLVNGQRQFKAGEIIMKDKSYNISKVELLTASVLQTRF